MKLNNEVNKLLNNYSKEMKLKKQTNNKYIKIDKQ